MQYFVSLIGCFVDPIAPKRSLSCAVLTPVNPSKIPKDQTYSLYRSEKQLE